MFIINFFKFLFSAVCFIFKAIGATIGFAFKILKSAIFVFGRSVELTAGLFGINSIAFEFFIAAIYGIVLSFIPDLITYYGCRLTDEYKNLKTNEERKEYVSRHTHFVLKDILRIKNKMDLKKSEEISEMETNNSRTGQISSDYVAQRIIQNNEPVNSFNENTLINEPDTEIIKDEQTNNETIIENNEISNNHQNIRLLYSSNIIGNMLRNGIVIKRRFSNADLPFIVDFNNKPKELFTGHSCDSKSGISFTKMIKGKKVEMLLDNPEFLTNPKLCDTLTIDELNELKEQLLSDQKYQKLLNEFFIINDKALKHKI